MFETSVVESKIQRRKSRTATMLLPVSVGLHVAALATATFAAVWDVGFPTAPPAQVTSAHLAELPKFDVPPGKPAGAKSVPRKPVEPPKQTTIPSDTAPNEIPKVIPTVAAAENPFAVEGGVGEGTSDGIVGGVGDGVDGSLGIVEETPIAPMIVGGDVKAPVVITRIEPLYPATMAKIRKNGLVIVQCIIDRDGRVQQVAAVRATNPLFESAAIEAVKQWRFQPGTLNGKAVDVIFHLTVNFTMKQG